ncbi:Polysaccharide biosynthesis/export protein [Roseivivax jejudonensis]|uniref:Polysaccharide biosynthesis/export protein n=1 Tax=Roseivivax jejudonensis TaxID=1529041 RepID=A0A1X6ZK31_9RHOB|nr:polysaccharide biosynthesis/export family protein [Roseivivax jejudonensis]SLN53371.1 Polysaccharide biosynthesis/export protein [Roseivivax jejudonensis]
MRRASRAALVAGAALIAGAAAAQEDGATRYRLVAGDTLAVDYVGADDTIAAPVDMDGDVRLPDVGGVPVAGLTLDEAERRIVAAITEAGLFVDPRASLSVESYAPIVVSGDVGAPGRHEFIPGMTVATALGLSGGAEAGGVGRYEIERARAEAAAGLRAANLEIAAQVVEIARLSAMRDDVGTVTLASDARARIPAPDRVDLRRLLSGADALLGNDRARRAELLDFWEDEIRTIEAQQALFDERILVQRDTAARVADELETARQLQARGLQTAARMSAAEQRDADAQSRVLELESARIAAARAISSAQRERSQFLRSWHDTALSGLNAARVALDAAELQYARYLELQALLSDGGIGALLTSDIVEVRFEIRSSRDGRPAPDAVDADTRVLPGDTLLVDVELATVSGG